jgi:hypothetical protein
MKEKTPRREINKKQMHTQSKRTGNEPYLSVMKLKAENLMQQPFLGANRRKIERKIDRKKKERKIDRKIEKIKKER